MQICTQDDFVLNSIEQSLWYLPNHFLFGATLATSPEVTELWNGAGFTIFPFLFLKEKEKLIEKSISVKPFWAAMEMVT